MSALIVDAGYVPMDVGGTKACQVMEAPRRPEAVYGEEYRRAEAMQVLGGMAGRAPDSAAAQVLTMRSGAISASGVTARLCEVQVNVIDVRLSEHFGDSCSSTLPSARSAETIMPVRSKASRRADEDSSSDDFLTDFGIA